MSDQFGNWYQEMEAQIKALNESNAQATFEVGEDDVVVAGDTMLCKGPEDEWEAQISGVKPGIWTVTYVNPGDDEVSGMTIKTVTQHSSALADLAKGLWKKAGEFSSDAGTWGLFSKTALDRMEIASGDREAMLESLYDWSNDLGGKLPTGVAGDGDDGGYVVQGVKDENGAWVALRIVMMYADDNEGEEEEEENGDDK